MLINAGPEDVVHRSIIFFLAGTSLLSKSHSRFYLGVCSGGSRTCLSMLLVLPTSGWLCDKGYKISSQCLSPVRRLHGGGCQRKEIRSRNDAPVFPCCTRSMGQIGSCVCVYTRAPSRSRSTWMLWRKQLLVKFKGETKVELESWVTE